MYFAWENEKNLIKMMTFIMIFIFVIMISISPVFAESIFSFVNCAGKDVTINLPDDYFNSKYHFIFEASNESSYTHYYFVYSNYELFIDRSNSTPVFRIKEEGKNITYGQAYCSIDTLNPSFSYNYNATGVSFLDGIYFSIYDINYSICDYTTGDEIYYPPIENPGFITTDEELATGNFQTLKINAGNFDSSLSEDINFGIFDITGRDLDLSTITELPNLMVYNIKLNFSSKYMVGEDGEVHYNIPQSDLGIDLSNDKKYYFVLANDEGERFDQIVFTVGGLTAEEELQNKQDQTNQKLDEQTDAIKESNETNKGIWETIKDILSYINPFSENFFVYKLIELLVEAIKSLFIPSDDFFSEYFTDLKDWFSDRLGFLFYPFELIIDILNKILNIDFENPIFNIPDIYEPFTDKKIISVTTFNLNDLLTNNIWKTVHDIYLIMLDAFIVFGLVNLFLRKYKEVTTE